MEVEIIKKIKFNISINLSGLTKGKKFIVHLEDKGNILDALAMVDRQDMRNPKDSIFPIFDGYIHNYLHLFWDPVQNVIYDDVGMMAYGPDENGLMRKFMPIRDNIEFNLYPNSVIDLQPDSGC